MKMPEPYWTYQGAPTPEVRDLPAGTFSGAHWGWESHSPGMRREIWRQAILLDAQERRLSAETIGRLKTALISGALSSLDEYLMAFERSDAARPTIQEDVDRLQRADAMHHKSEVQIAARAKSAGAP